MLTRKTLCLVGLIVTMVAKKSPKVPVDEKNRKSRPSEI